MSNARYCVICSLCPANIPSKLSTLKNCRNAFVSLHSLNTLSNLFSSLHMQRSIVRTTLLYACVSRKYSLPDLPHHPLIAPPLLTRLLHDPHNTRQIHREPLQRLVRVETLHRAVPRCDVGERAGYSIDGRSEGPEMRGYLEDGEEDVECLLSARECSWGFGRCGVGG